MTDTLMTYEVVFRLGAFFTIFLIMALWELMAPCRQLLVSKRQRWLSNLSMVALNSLLLRLFFPAAAVGAASFAIEDGWGLFNVYSLPPVLEIVLAIIILDLVIYLQHVMVHAIPALWRLHRVHHADIDFDVTTGARFHPIEMILSMLIKFAAILLLGPALVAVVIFEVLLNATAMFNHSNVQLPKKIDRLLRWLVVTPDMHRVHHSIEDDETNSNFGFNLPWWDRLMGTYQDQPRLDHQQMQIGIRGFRDAQQVNRLPGMLLLPFIGKVSGYAINRRQWQDNNVEND